MITLFHKTYRNPDKEPSPYLPAILLGCVFVLMPLGISAQNAPAGPIGAGASSDQAPAAQTQTPAASSDAHPNLAGTWQLNKKQSDDPREKMREARNDQGNGGGGGGFGRGGGGRGMGRGRQGQGQGGDMMKEFSQLTITQTSSTAKVTGGIGPRPCSLLRRRSIAKPVRSRRFEQVRQLHAGTGFCGSTMAARPACGDHANSPRHHNSQLWTLSRRQTTLCDNTH